MTSQPPLAQTRWVPSDRPTGHPAVPFLMPDIVCGRCSAANWVSNGDGIVTCGCCRYSVRDTTHGAVEPPESPSGEQNLVTSLSWCGACGKCYPTDIPHDDCQTTDKRRSPWGDHHGLIVDALEFLWDARTERRPEITEALRVVGEWHNHDVETQHCDNRCPAFRYHGGGFCAGCGAEHRYPVAYLDISDEEAAALAKPRPKPAPHTETETGHMVTFAVGFTIQHPLRERLHGDLDGCDLHRYCEAMTCPPPLGRYRVERDPVEGGWSFHLVEATA